MTIVMEFPKGIVTAPSKAQRLHWLLADNSALLIGLIGLVALWIYYMQAWRRSGRDPSAGTIIAQYDPPAGFSPAELRYLRRMGYDNRCLSSDIVAMGVAGFVVINRDKHLLSEAWSLMRPEQARGLPDEPAQRVLLQGLLPSPGDVLELKDSNADVIGPARSAHQAALKAEMHKRYFVTNGSTVGIGFGLTVLTGLLVFGLGAHGGLPLGIALLVLMIVTNILFAYLMKAPTAAGRKLMDQAEGLKLYLGVADRDELRGLKLPEAAGHAQPKLDADRFQLLLPYALALGVEEAWTKKFTSAVGEAAAERAAQSAAWYSGGNTGALNFASMSQSIGSSFNSAIASSATPPGSISGGAGSSGGGGGGGW